MLEGGRKLLIFAHHRIVLNGICEGLVKSVSYHIIIIIIYITYIKYIEISLCKN